MKKSIVLTVLLLLIAPVGSLSAAESKSSKVNCNKKTLTSELAKLDKSEPNTVKISGACTDDVLVSGFKDLTLVGSGGASLTATSIIPGDFDNSTTALLIEDSHVTVEALTINGGLEGVTCTRRSVCVLRDVIVQGGNGGVSFQDQSAGDILGSSAIQDTLGLGLGIYGASKVNMRPDPFVPEGVGPVISGNPDGGIIVIDGSFLRTDNTTISDNGAGVLGFRNVVLKIFFGAVSNNADTGIAVFRSSTAQIISEASNNGGDGLFVESLSFAQVGGSVFLDNGGLDVNCSDSTVIVAQIGGATLGTTNCP